jgi:hypothetical protein
MSRKAAQHRSADHQDLPGSQLLPLINKRHDSELWQIAAEQHDSYRALEVIPHTDRLTTFTSVLSLKYVE